MKKLLIVILMCISFAAANEFDYLESNNIKSCYYWDEGTGYSNDDFNNQIFWCETKKRNFQVVMEVITYKNEIDGIKLYPLDDNDEIQYFTLLFSDHKKTYYTNINGQMIKIKTTYDNITVYTDKIIHSSIATMQKIRENKREKENQQKYVKRKHNKKKHYHSTEDGNGWECDDGCIWGDDGDHCIKEE
jgi:hypothetical protein